MAYRFAQRPIQATQAKAARLQAEQQQKMLRVTGALVGLTLAVGGLISLIQNLR
jgi:hypothetical protein